MKQRGMTHSRKQALADHPKGGDLILASHTKCQPRARFHLLLTPETDQNKKKKKQNKTKKMVKRFLETV